MGGSGDEGDITPALSDGVIRLNGFQLDDISEHLAGEDEEQARRFGWFPARSSEATVRAAIERWQHEWLVGGDRLAWAARELDSGALVGGCEIQRREDAS